MQNQRNLNKPNRAAALLIVAFVACAQILLFIRSSAFDQTALIDSPRVVDVSVSRTFTCAKAIQKRNKRIPQRLVFLGISSPSHLFPLIGQTYLNSTNGKHSFSSVCAWDEFVSAFETKRQQCLLIYQLFPEGTSIRNWWNQVLLQTRVGTDPWVVWVPGATMLYPPHFNDLLFELECAFPESGTDIWLETPSYDSPNCQTLSKRKDRIVCQRLSGELVLTRATTLRKSTHCWNGTDSTFLQQSSRPPFLSQNSCTNTTIPYVLPKQYHIPEADTEKWIAMWKKLTALHHLNATVHFVTAKFGRDEHQFYDEVQAAKESIQRFGAGPSQIFAYDQFPDFIANSSLWSDHLEFRYNHSLPPKGAGYWFWKAPLILHHLNNLDWGDFVAYCDVDLGDHFKWMVSLLETMSLPFEGGSMSNLALYRVDYSDLNYTKQDVWEAMCPNMNLQVLRSQAQYAGGWMVVRKTRETIKFIQEWQSWKSRFSLLNDSPSRSENQPGFQYHLHDQSILSLLLKCRYPKSYDQRRSFAGATSLKHWEVEFFPMT